MTRDTPCLHVIRIRVIMGATTTGKAMMMNNEQNNDAIFQGVSSLELDGKHVRVTFKSGTVVDGILHAEVGTGFIEASKNQNITILDQDRHCWRKWPGVITVEEID